MLLPLLIQRLKSDAITRLGAAEIIPITQSDITKLLALLRGGRESDATFPLRLSSTEVIAITERDVAEFLALLGGGGKSDAAFLAGLLRAFVAVTESDFA